MKQIKILGLFLAVLILLTPVNALADETPPETPAAVAVSPYSGKVTVERPESAGQQDQYQQAAQDYFQLIYNPSGAGLDKTVLCSIYTVPMLAWNTLDGALEEGYEIYKQTPHFVYLLKRGKANPYPEDSLDFKRFAGYLNNVDASIDDLGIEEVPVTSQGFAGQNLAYRVPLIKSMTGVNANCRVKGASDLFEEAIDFVFTPLVKGEKPVTALRLEVYSKEVWEKQAEVIGAEKVSELMGLVFAVSNRDGNSFPAGATDAIRLEVDREILLTSLKKPHVFVDSVPSVFYLTEGLTKTRLLVNGYNSNYFVYTDGDGQPLFPLRAVAEALGYHVDWDPVSAAALVKTPGDQNETYTVAIEGAYAGEGKVHDVNVTACLIKGRTYVNGDFLINALGAVIWCDIENTINVTK